MIKKMKMFFGCLLMCMLFCISGCKKEITSITDFTKFNAMTQDTDKIEVVFDNGGAPYYFDIEDENDIDAVMEILFTSTFENVGSKMKDGNNTWICIIQGENRYDMHIRMNKESGNYYSFSNEDLQIEIEKLAIKAGLDNN